MTNSTYKWSNFIINSSPEREATETYGPKHTDALRKKEEKAEESKLRQMCSEIWDEYGGMV